MFRKKIEKGKEWEERVKGQINKLDFQEATDTRTPLVSRAGIHRSVQACNGWMQRLVFVDEVGVVDWFSVSVQANKILCSRIGLVYGPLGEDLVC